MDGFWDVHIETRSGDDDDLYHTEITFGILTIVAVWLPERIELASGEEKKLKKKPKFEIDVLRAGIRLFLSKMCAVSHALQCNCVRVRVATSFQCLFIRFPLCHARSHQCEGLAMSVRALTQRIILATFCGTSSSLGYCAWCSSWNTARSPGTLIRYYIQSFPSWMNELMLVSTKILRAFDECVRLALKYTMTNGVRWLLLLLLLWIHFDESCIFYLLLRREGKVNKGIALVFPMHSPHAQTVHWDFQKVLWNLVPLSI